MPDFKFNEQLYHQAHVVAFLGNSGDPAIKYQGKTIFVKGAPEGTKVGDSLTLKLNSAWMINDRLANAQYAFHIPPTALAGGETSLS